MNHRANKWRIVLSTEDGEGVETDCRSKPSRRDVLKMCQLAFDGVLVGYEKGECMLVCWEIVRPGADYEVVDSGVAEVGVMSGGRVQCRMLENPKAVCLWDLPASEWKEWVATGCGDTTFGDYCTLIQEVRAEAEKSGIEAKMVQATVREVLDALKDLNLDNTASGRAAAIAVLGAKQ